MSDLVAFLRARVDEDEHYCRTMIEVGERNAAAATPTDMADITSMAMSVLDDPQVLPLLRKWLDGGTGLPPNDLHRLLREVEAKRKILAVAKVNREMLSSEPLDTDLDRGAADGARVTTSLVLIALAEIWKDHPDYDPDWTP